jgi:RNA polymerase sigma-70 factor (ECF subfamily)
MSFPLLFDAIRGGDDAERTHQRTHQRLRQSDTTALHREAIASDDEMLVARIRAGDVAAFDTVFARFWAPLWRFARAELDTDALAEDVVQDVFARVWTRRDQWIPTHGVQAYLYRAVRNAITDRRRHHRVMRAHVKWSAHENAAAAIERTGVDAATERGDLLARLELALARLPETKRQAVVLRYEHGLSYQALATVLEMSPAAAEKQVMRTLATLRAWLEG